MRLFWLYNVISVPSSSISISWPRHHELVSLPRAESGTWLALAASHKLGQAFSPDSRRWGHWPSGPRRAAGRVWGWRGRSRRRGLCLPAPPGPRSTAPAAAWEPGGSEGRRGEREETPRGALTGRGEKTWMLINRLINCCLYIKSSLTKRDFDTFGHNMWNSLIFLYTVMCNDKWKAVKKTLTPTVWIAILISGLSHLVGFHTSTYCLYSSSKHKNLKGIIVFFSGFSSLSRFIQAASSVLCYRLAFFFCGKYLFWLYPEICIIRKTVGKLLCFLINKNIISVHKYTVYIQNWQVFLRLCFLSSLHFNHHRCVHHHHYAEFHIYHHHNNRNASFTHNPQCDRAVMKMPQSVMML